MGIGTYIQFLMALVFVLTLIGAFAMALRRFGPGAGLAVRPKGPRRLAIVEVLALDARRRLVLVRRDGTEHLLLLGATNDIVVETGVPSPPPPADFQAQLAEAGRTGNNRS